MGLRTLIRKYREKRKQKKANNGLGVKFSTPKPFSCPEYVPPAPAPAKQPPEVTKFVVVAQFAFTASSPDECSFEAGDLLSVIDDTQGDWWLAINRRTCQRGLIPDNYVVKDSNLEGIIQAWQDVDRVEAEQILISPGIAPGMYILRPTSDVRNNGYALSVRGEGMEISHFMVRFLPSEHKFYISLSVQFDTIRELLEYYSRYPITKELGLTDPVPKVLVPPLTIRDCVIKFKDIKLGQILGEGNFGKVFRATIGNAVVAVKQSHGKTSSESFIQEAKNIHMLSHKRIVKFIGISDDAPDGSFLIVTEFMEKGSLKSFLATPEGLALSYSDLMFLVHQILEGMVYLESVNFVHRDLRAANILIDSKNRAKIADFGLTEIPDMGKDIGITATPVRWTAPEVLCGGKNFTTKSDVWSFGVLVYEILTHGKQPYEGIPLSEVRSAVLSGVRLPQPEVCESIVYTVMQACWEVDPNQRPSFVEITTRLRPMNCYGAEE